jgi:hypothetical protein
MEFADRGNLYRRTEIGWSRYQKTPVTAPYDAIVLPRIRDLVEGHLL